jgi:hypothetical protein
MERWGMPSTAFALQSRQVDCGVTNVRNTASPHWRRWLVPASRCLMPFTSFREPGLNAKEGSVGDSNDNALPDTKCGLHKTEVINRQGPWRSFEAVECATLKWVNWFSQRRLLEPMHTEIRECYYAIINMSAIAVRRKPINIRQTQR